MIKQVMNRFVDYENKCQALHGKHLDIYILFLIFMTFCLWNVSHIRAP